MFDLRSTLIDEVKCGASKVRRPRLGPIRTVGMHHGDWTRVEAMTVVTHRDSQTLVGGLLHIKRGNARHHRLDGPRDAWAGGVRDGWNGRLSIKQKLVALGPQSEPQSRPINKQDLSSQSLQILPNPSTRQSSRMGIQFSKSQRSRATNPGTD